MSETRAKALAIIEAIDLALGAGIEHRNRAGILLVTTESILATLIEEGGVTLDMPFEDATNYLTVLRTGANLHIKNIS